jgi:hypothetical protein
MYTSSNIPLYTQEKNPTNYENKNVGEPMCGEKGDCFEYFTNNFGIEW